METPKLICNARWMAPRVEVESVPVQHVCALKYGHEGQHVCSCGKVDTEVSQQYESKRPASLEMACPVNWDAKRYCRAWGAKGPHGCKYKPGHEGVHRCPCGSKHD